MTTREALCALFLAILIMTAGFVWLYEAWGLVGGGVATAALVLLTDKKEDDDG